MSIISSSQVAALPNASALANSLVRVKITLDRALGSGESLETRLGNTVINRLMVQVTPLIYYFEDRLSPGTYNYTVNTLKGSTIKTGNTVTITVSNVNCAWSPTVNQDGPYVVGAGGAHNSIGQDFDWTNDNFWIGAVGTFSPLETIEWQTTWEPGSDGFSKPPILIEHAANTSNPRRLQIRPTSPGGSQYDSGVLTINMLVNGVVRGDTLQLVLADDQYSYEAANWAVFAAV